MGGRTKIVRHMEDGEQHLVRFPLRRTFVRRPSLSAAPNRPAFKHTLALIVPAYAVLASAKKLLDSRLQLGDLGFDETAARLLGPMAPMRFLVSEFASSFSLGPGLSTRNRKKAVLSIEGHGAACTRALKNTALAVLVPLDYGLGELAD